MSIKTHIIDGRTVTTANVAQLVPVGPRHVFNLEVDVDHQYYANGILTKNSNYHDILKHYNRKHGEEFFKLKDTFISYKHRRLLVYPAGPNKKTLRGRCVVGSSLTSTNKGFLRFDELVDNSGYTQVDGILVDSPVGALPVSHTYCGTSKTIKVTTHNGFTVEGTPEHPLLVVTNELKFKWKSLDTIQVGDWILAKTKNNTPLYGNNTQVTMELATILGHRAGSSSEVLPLAIRTAPQEIMHAFLEAYFAVARVVNNGSAQIEIVLFGTELATQLHVLLYHYYNILGRLEPALTERQVWLITIVGEDALRFLVTFKQAKVQNFNAITPVSLERRIVPYLREFLAEGYALTKPDLLHQQHVASHALPESQVYAERRLPLRLNDEQQQIVNLHAHYEEVVKVEPCATLKTVYDLTVPEHHMFTTNSLTSHNTRFFCLAGDTLVSTNRGLLPISQNLTGLSCNTGDSNRNIVGHTFTGKQKIAKLTLVNGLVLHGTPEHKVLVVLDHKLKWKNIEDLSKNDYCVVSLGGDFPDSLSLSFVSNEEKPVWEKMLDFIKDKSTFNIDDIFNNVHGFSNRNAVTAKTSWLVNAGYVAKKRIASSRFSEYTVVKDIEALREQRISTKTNKARRSVVFPTQLTAQLSRVLGYLVADGNYVQNFSEIDFSTTDEIKVNRFIADFTQVFNHKPRLATWTTKGGKTAYKVVFSLKKIREFFTYIGLIPAASKDKKIPWCIMQAPRKCVLEFVSTLFSCDGSFNNSIEYRSLSITLCKDLQLLLLRLGYPSRIRNDGGYYSVILRESPSAQFELEYTGVSNGLRRTKTPLGKKREFSSACNTDYVIPNSEYFTLSELNSSTNARYSKLIDRNIIFVRVKSVAATEKVLRVYDIQVDKKDHSFTANGIVVHNSSVDEIGWFNAEAKKNMVKMDANEIYVALDRSLLTVRAAARKLIRQGFDDIPNAFAFNISSPSAARDKIMELVAQSRGSTKLLGFKCATWEMNPNISKDDLSEEFRKDPQAAERDYACNPPLSDNAFFSTFASIEDCFVGKPNKIKYSYGQRQAKDGSITRYVILDEASPSTKPNVLAIDAGLAHDSFALVVAHVHNGMPIITCMCEIAPNPGMPLNHSLIFSEFIVPLIKERNVKFLISDRWQNIKILQDAALIYDDLVTLSRSLRYEDFWLVKQTMFDGEVVFPRLKRKIEDILAYDQSKYPHCFTNPVEHFALQCLTVRDLGNSVGKGDNTTDDIFRCCCLIIYLVNEAEYFEQLNIDGQELAATSGNAIGYAAMKSGSSGKSSGEVVMSSSGKALGVVRSRS